MNKNVNKLLSLDNLNSGFYEQETYIIYRMFFRRVYSQI